MLSKHPHSPLHFLAMFCVSKSNLSFYNFMLPCSILPSIHSRILSLIPFLSDDPSAFQLVILLSWFSPPPSLSLSCAGSHTCCLFMITMTQSYRLSFLFSCAYHLSTHCFVMSHGRWRGLVPSQTVISLLPQWTFFKKFASRRVKKHAASISVWEQ